MIDNATIERILSIPDNETGGDNALDGFEFQVSTAIYLMFEELKNKNDFALVYEKIEDFIIFTDKIHLYQAKSINVNLTPRVLYKPTRVTKSEESSLSIIERMYDNYSSVKDNIQSHEIDCNLLICENRTFSTKLGSNVQSLKKINFQDLSKDVKKEIIKNTKHIDYDWANINAIRLIPKSRHEEVTRIFIEDVINSMFGENRINSIALYNCLMNEIKKIRRNKEKLTNTFVESQINKYTRIEDDLNFRDHLHLLDERDKRNIKINYSFDTMKNLLKISNHPVRDDYNRIEESYKSNNIDSFYSMYDIIKAQDCFKDIRIRLDDYKIKALILIIIAKELS